MWLLYLVFKSFAVSPMYVSVVLLPFRVTVASRIQSLTLHYNTSTTRATIHQSLQKTFPQVSTDAYHLSHPTKPPSTKPRPPTRKHSTTVDTAARFTTNPPIHANRKTDNAITFYGTTHPLARTPVPTLDVNSSP